MTGEEKKAIKSLKEFAYTIHGTLSVGEAKIILQLIQKQQEEMEEIKEYANWHKEHLTEDIKDYIDDDKIANANIVSELKEEREHWKDVLRILNKEKTYIDYKNY